MRVYGNFRIFFDAVESYMFGPILLLEPELITDW